MHKHEVILLVLLSISLLDCAGLPHNATSSSLSQVYAINKGQTHSAESGDGPGEERLAAKTQQPVFKRLSKSKYGNPHSYEVRGKVYTTLDSAKGYRKRGTASWYGSKFHGRLTSSREVYDMYQLTAAHRTLPIPTYARVTNLNNGKAIILKINDRGPFHDDRIIDLSYAAAVKLDFAKHGTANVEVQALSYSDLSPEKTQRVENKLVTNESTSSPGNLSDQQSGMYIQLGAFSNKGNAATFEDKVRNIIPGAAVRTIHSIDRKIYTVRMGPLRSKSLVNELLNELDRGGLKDHRIIIN